jgi:hypothetical protein
MRLLVYGEAHAVPVKDAYKNRLTGRKAAAISSARSP